MLVLVIVILLVVAIAAAVAIPRLGGTRLRTGLRRPGARPVATRRRQPGRRTRSRGPASEDVLLAEGEEIQLEVEARMVARGVPPHKLSGPNPPTAAERIDPRLADRPLPRPAARSGSAQPAAGAPYAQPLGGTAYVGPPGSGRDPQPAVGSVGYGYVDADGDLSQPLVRGPSGSLEYGTSPSGLPPAVVPAPDQPVIGGPGYVDRSAVARRRRWPTDWRRRPDL